MFEELQGYAALRDPETGIEARFGPDAPMATGLTQHSTLGWPRRARRRSDNLIPNSLREKLLAAVTPLENVPDSEKDWRWLPLLLPQFGVTLAPLAMSACPAFRVIVLFPKGQLLEDDAHRYVRDGLALTSMGLLLGL